MEEIARRKQAETLLAQATELATLGNWCRCVEVCEAGLEVKGSPQLSLELRKLLDFAAGKVPKPKKPKVRKIPISEAAKVLGVDRECSLDDLQKAYRRESLKAHPDRGGTTEAFARVADAFQAMQRVAKPAYDAEAAIAAFKELLHRAEVPSSWSFGSMQASLGKSREFLDVRTQGERRQAYAEYRTAKEKLEREADRRARVVARDNFAKLLDEYGSITPDTPWAFATRLLAREPRYKAVPEKDRPDLFQDWVQDEKRRLASKKRRRSP
ncbi:hypothetical protein CTAYLR_001695 [Chrysophaeum taylorii]|uniref:J domain-containing protein n=1 Tax=Chrysophaeum taylorii TaxID=2483200 RepID=A0AAD7XHH9_9STRA|nr:hypothetical protein CTAYLR_001695 [Chrysophaeum taylorii]